MDAQDSHIKKGLVDTVRRARIKGMTWERISNVLGLSQTATLKQFGYIDNELIKESFEKVPPDLTVTDTPQLEPDLSAIANMTIEELTTLGQTTSTRIGSNRRTHEGPDRAVREAVVIALYQRDLRVAAIANIIGRSTQRVRQIVSNYYDRIETEWEAQRRA